MIPWGIVKAKVQLNSTIKRPSDAPDGNYIVSAPESTPLHWVRDNLLPPSAWEDLKMLGFALLSGHVYADATVDVLGATHKDVDDRGFNNCREVNDGIIKC